MIGSGFKKLALSHNMRVDKGVAYGNLRGYAATFFEGTGYKTIQITTVFKEPQLQFELQSLLNGKNLLKEYRVQEILFSNNHIGITFHDNPGTLKKISSFIEWFFPLLDTYGATGVNICTECGEDIISGQWKLIDGIAYYMHSSCASRVKEALKTETDTMRREDPGSYITGLIGAALGAALGAVLWALVLFIGYVASVVGFVIGWLAEKGYCLLRGKNGKGKLLILIFSIIFGVLLGTALGETFSIIDLIRKNELYGLTYSDIPWLLSSLINDTEYITSVLGNVGLGILFAALGVFSLLKRTSKEVSDIKFIDLD